MTTPVEPSQLFDTGNKLLTQAPVDMQLGTITGPQGTLGFLTFRSSTTTMTVFSDGEGLQRWASLISALAGELGVSGKLAVASPLDVAALRQKMNGQKLWAELRAAR